MTKDVALILGGVVFAAVGGISLKNGNVAAACILFWVSLSYAIAFGVSFGMYAHTLEIKEKADGGKKTWIL